MAFTAREAVVQGIKFGQCSLRVSRSRDKPEERFGDQAERPFGGGKKRVQIVAGHILDRLPAGFQDSAVGQHHGQTQNIVPRHAIFQTARPARVAGDVAADGGMADARRVGRIKKPDLFDFRLQFRRDDSGLHADGRIRRIDFQDPVHAREADDDSAGANRDGSGRKSRSHAARNDGDARLRGDLYDFGRLFGRLRQHDHVGNAFGKGAVIAVDGKIFRCAQHAVLADDPDEMINNPIFHPHPHRLHPIMSPGAPPARAIRAAAIPYSAASGSPGNPKRGCALPCLPHCRFCGRGLSAMYRSA